MCPEARRLKEVIAHDALPFRLLIAAQLLAMGAVRAHFGAPRSEEPAQASAPRPGEPAWLTATLAAIALLHFGAILAYLAHPPLLAWSAFEVGAPARWIGIGIGGLGAAGEIWAAVSLGTSYSPRLRVAEEHVVVTAGPYRWIRHPLYAFWLPVMTGWGVAAGNWFVLASGTVLILVLLGLRVPREESMLLAGLGHSYRRYMARTGRFLPRFRSASRADRR
jgi:protein-S-isoprenylcysteine O-methyltransferase Ste14